MRKETSLKEAFTSATSETLNAVSTTMIAANDVLQTIELMAKIVKTELADIYIGSNKELVDRLNEEERERYSKFLN